MRWNCPHCGTSLAVADDKIGNGWSFSRCYKCAGFALVRRSDVNMIKVDRAPEGEPVLLPEANEDPTMMLSQAATQHLARYVGAKNDLQAERNIQISAAKPIIRAAKSRGAQAQARAQAQTPSRPQAQAHTQSKDSFGLPAPLPEEPERTVMQRLSPFAIGFAGMFTIASGVYLYIQGQALWQKARSPSAESTAAAASANPGSAEADDRADNHAARAPSAPGREIIAPAPAVPRGASVAGSANPALTASAAARGPEPAPEQELAAVMVDEVHARAMAPNRQSVPAAREVSPAQNTRLEIEVINHEAHVRSGPGLQYPRVAQLYAKPGVRRRYTVEERKDRWYRINLDENRSAWIRDDLVRPVR